MPIPKNYNEIEVLPRLPTSITDGSKNVTTAGSRVQIVTATTYCIRIIITAKAANTGTIWVGGATVANGSGIPLVALQSVLIDIDDLSKIYLDSTVSLEGITYAYLV